MILKIKIISIIILLSSLIIPITINAAVPVVVFGDYLNTVYNVEELWNIHENTDFELSLETFMYKLFGSLMERQEEFTKTFELAKIEKAREDVNKLMFETQRELTGQGVITNIKDPTTGKDYSIKKEGRIITNPDDFLYEEPIQKARDFAYCYLAPWKHFAWGNDTQYCGDLELEGEECTSQNVCLMMPVTPVVKGGSTISQCPSDTIKDAVKQRLLNELVRKEQNWKLAPPESWYTPAICEKVLNSVSCVNTEKCFTGCDLISGSCDVKNTNSLSTEDRAKIYDTHSTLTKSVAYDDNATIYNYQQTISNPNNNPTSLEKILRQRIGSIIAEYQQLRQAQYIAGQGIRPEKFLLGLTDKSENCARYYSVSTGNFEIGSGSCREFDEGFFFGRPLNMNYGGDKNAYSDKTFWFDTENITSPAIVLLQKMAAAAQAQFDLAQKAYKYPADNSEVAITTVKNKSGEFKEEINFYSPTTTKLVAPWEDDNAYAKLPEEYINDWYGTHPDDIGDIFGDGYYLNRWYKDITQMYLPNQEEEDNAFSRTLKNWFCLEDKDSGELDTKCFNQRNPKEYDPKSD